MVYRMSVGPAIGLRHEIDRLFDDAFGGGTFARRGTSWAPPVDIGEDEKELTISVELPGVSPDRVEITAEHGVLTIRGEKSEVKKEGDETARYHTVERTYGSFTRSFQLPAGLDEGKITAGYEHGVLTVHVPKAALPTPRRIEISNAR